MKGGLRMRMSAAARGTVVLAVVGTLVSAQQARGESVFTSGGGRCAPPRVLQGLVLPNAALSVCGGSALEFASFRGDTVETINVEVEEHKGPSLFKELAVFAIVTAAVGYAVIVLMKSDDSSPTKTKPTKPVPTASTFAGIAVPFTRSR